MGKELHSAAAMLASSDSGVPSTSFVYCPGQVLADKLLAAGTFGSNAKPVHSIKSR